MVTSGQSEFFARLFELEDKRTDALGDRAKWYLSLSAIYSAANGLTVEHFQPSSMSQYLVFIASNVALVFAFVLSLWAVRVATFEGVDDPVRAYKQLQTNSFDETKFLIDCMAAYAVAAQRNQRVNARQARVLALAGHLILVGIVANGLYFSLFLLPKGYQWPKIL